MEKITIVIADDHKLVRETWAFILDSDHRFEVLAECGDSELALYEVRQRKPNVVLMDINIPPITGFEATTRIKRSYPSSKVIAVSMHTRPAYAKQMFEAGASGYITKNSPKEEMMDAILAVHNGKKYVCSEMKNNISSMMLAGSESQPDISMLTPKEIEIVNLIKRGESSKSIANIIGITYKTVEVHRHNILKKLKLRNAASLINFVNNSQICM